MKPRQLSVAISDEVGNKLTIRISEGVWGIIRLPDGMKNEITEMVQSVYNKLVEPERKEEAESSIPDAMIVDNGTDNKGPVNAPAFTVDHNLSDSGLNEPPGFPLSNSSQNNNHEKEDELQLPMPCGAPAEENEELPSHSKDMLEVDDGYVVVPPGFSANVELKELVTVVM